MTNAPKGGKLGIGGEIMEKQMNFTDYEYSLRKRKTKREEFLEIMDEIIPWDEWVGVIEPYYPKGKRGRPPMGIEKMLRMYLLQIWCNLSDPATEDAIYDSYAMRKFTGINFMTEAVPDETTLCKFRHLLETNGLNKLFFDAINRVMVEHFQQTVIGGENCLGLRHLPELAVESFNGIGGVNQPEDLLRKLEVST